VLPTRTGKGQSERMGFHMPIHVFENGQANMDCLQAVSAASRRKLDALDLAPVLVKSVVMPACRVASRGMPIYTQTLPHKLLFHN
jgi:hypothetical protein